MGKQKTVPQVKVTAHGFDQYVKRVHKGSLSEIRKADISFWATEGVMNGKNLGKFQDGHTHYLYQGHTIVIADNNNLVTVNPYHAHLDDDSGYSEINQDISSIIKKRLSKQIKPYERKKRELLIQMHESEIKKLRVYNPDTQKIIAKKIRKLKEDIQQVDRKIEGIKGVGNNYQVEV